ncbi:MAG: TonB-dependent receptor domain-containing protein, partial [Prevotella sp.]
RAPTFNESYFFHYGSTTLLPESTDQWNVGLTWRQPYGNGSSVQLTADGYVNHVKDKIVAVPFNMFVWTNINVGKVLARGVDASLEARHRFGSSRHSLIFSANYSYQRVENRTNPESPFYKNQLAYTPEHSGSGALGYENPWLNLSFHGTAVSQRYANNEHYNGTALARYAEFGITAYRGFNFGRHSLELRADVKNLLNRHYEVVKNYPMPGRSWMFSLSYNM